jgi:hypothetical protein
MLHIDSLSSFFSRTARRNTKKKVYDNIPQMASGSPKKIDQGLWETVSQLIAFEMAQKEEYEMSV